MRILLINWAKIWDGATGGGGVNGYCQALALELKDRGHEVVYLFGGMTITPDPHAARPAPAESCSIRRHDDWLGVRIFELINSPVLAPAAFQFRNPAAEASSPVLARAFAAFVKRLEPDIVHFHNIEGFSADCIRAVRDAGGRSPAILYSLHNYHTICPQAYLLRRYTTPCLDFQGGAACETCIDAVDPVAERLRRAEQYARSVNMAPLTVSASTRNGQDPVDGFDDRIAGLRSWAASRPLHAPLPGYECETEVALNHPRATPGPDARGQTAQILAELNPPPSPGPTDPAWQPVSNVIPNEPRVDPDDPASNRFGVRRSRMVDALNACDRVLAVSEYVRRRFVSAGVRDDLVTVQHIGSRINRVVDRLRDLAFPPPPFDPSRPRPIRLVFMGYNSVYKGLPMLADTLDLMTPEYLARFHLYLFAQDGQSIEWRFRRLEPRLAGLTVYHGYQYHDIPWMLGGKDLGLVTSVWWDNAPQTVFEFAACGVPVLAADIGGIPDFVREGHNGLLFAANDRYDLARRLAEVARDPALTGRLRACVTPPKDIAVHAAELETTYASCLSSASGAAVARTSGEMIVTPGGGLPAAADAV